MANYDGLDTSGAHSGAKRRRLNGFTPAPSLMKPFRSPLRPAQPAQPTPGLDEETQKSQTPCRPATSSVQGTAAGSEVAASSTPPRMPPRRPMMHSRPHVSSPLSKQDASAVHRGGQSVELMEAIASAQRAQNALVSQIARARQDIDSLRQAVSLTSGTQDEALSGLIEKWTVAARAAAEEVFSSTKDRVNRMGGVGAWRQREQQQQEWRKQWDEPGPGSDDSTDGDDGDDDAEVEYSGTREEVERPSREDRREMRAMRRELREEKRLAGDEPHTPDEREAAEARGGTHSLMQGEDDDTFTMDMMLAMLNVDPNVIGYSKEHQMWIA